MPVPNGWERIVLVKLLHVTLRSMNVPETSAGSNGFAIRADRVLAITRWERR